MAKKLNCVLLVDDDDATNFINKMVVEKAGIADRIEIVLNGRDALHFLTGQGKFESNGADAEQPALILLDINMPIMDGWEFLEQYQSLELHKKGHVVIVMLSTSFNPDDQVRANKMFGVSGYRHKPLTLAILDEIIKEHF